MLIRSLNITEVRPIELRQFVPRGQTALYDAIGSSLKYFMEKKLHNPTCYNKCLIYVATDGIFVDGLIEHGGKLRSGDGIVWAKSTVGKAFNNISGG